MACQLARWVLQLLRPGDGMALPHVALASGAVDAGAFTLKDFVTHLVPTSIVDAMARNEILKIVVFSVFVGSAISALERKAPVLLQDGEVDPQYVVLAAAGVTGELGADIARLGDVDL